MDGSTMRFVEGNMKTFQVTLSQELTDGPLNPRDQEALNKAVDQMQKAIDEHIIEELVKQSKPSRVSGNRHDRPILNRKPK